MAYTKTNWVNLSSPYINQTNLNHLEEGVYDADQRSLTNEANITALDGRLGTVETNISTAQGDITALDGRLDTAETNIGTHGTRLDNAELNITTAQGDIITLDGRLDTAEADIATLEGNRLVSVTSPDSSLTIDASDPINPTVVVNIDKFLGRITADTTLYVSTTGNDTTGNGSLGAPWLTIGKAISFLNQYLINSNVTVTVSIANGTYTITSELLINHPCGSCISFLGNGLTTTIISFAGTINGFNIKTAVKSIANLKIISTVAQSGYGVLIDRNAIASWLYINTNNLERGISVSGGWAVIDGGTHGSNGSSNNYGIFVSRGKVDIISDTETLNSTYNILSNLYGLLSIINITGTANFNNSTSSSGISVQSCELNITGTVTASSNASFGLQATQSTLHSSGSFTTSTHNGVGDAGIIATVGSKLFFSGTLVITNNTTGIIAERFSLVDIYNASTTFSGNTTNASPIPGTANDPVFANYGSYIFDA